MADLLDRIHGEIRARLRASEVAVREYERLEAALAALSGDPVPATSRARAANRGLASRDRHAVTAPVRRSKRSQRGANRAAALRAIGEHPGAGVAELIEATGITRAVLYTLLGRLAGHGEIVKQALPGGRSAYSLAEAAGSETPIEADAPAESPANDRSGVQAEASTADAESASDAAQASLTTSWAESASSAAPPSSGPYAVAGDDAPEEPSTDSPLRSGQGTRGEARGGGDARSAEAEGDTAAPARPRRKPKAKPAARKASAAKPKAKPSRPARSQQATSRRGPGKPKPPRTD